MNFNVTLEKLSFQKEMKQVPDVEVANMSIYVYNSIESLLD